MDINLYYEEIGNGPTLILLHGNGGDHTYFREQIVEYGKHYHVFAIDSRGHGKTQRGSMPFTIEQMATDLHDFMEEHQIGKASILGFSDGGNIALTFALTYPDMVDKMILNSANIDPNGVNAEIQQSIHQEYSRLGALKNRTMEEQEHFEILGLIENSPRYDKEQLSRLNIPVLVIAGDDDLITREHTYRIHSYIPGSKLVFLPGDHLVASENSKEFNREVLEFLQMGKTQE